jgi:glutathione synthase/RimK-type ligase-like ATP-grasp enzyme
LLPTILLVTSAGDVATDQLAAHIDTTKFRIHRLNWDEYLSGMTVRLNTQGEFRFTHDATPLDCEHVCAVHLRRWPTIWVEPGTMSIGFQELLYYSQNVAFNDALLALLETALPNTYWMSHPAAYTLADNKVAVLQLAAKYGLRIPATIITTSPATLREFSHEHEPHKICYKLTSSVAPWVRYNDADTEKELVGIYTNIVTEQQLDHADLLTKSPALFQTYIEKQHELRITFVAGEFFTCKIDSQASSIANIDWRRYDIPHTPHTQETLPACIAASLTNLMRHIGLEYGCIDMILGADGEYYFLEVNPTGAYRWIELLTNMPITSAIANALMNHGAART